MHCMMSYWQQQLMQNMQTNPALWLHYLWCRLQLQYSTISEEFQNQTNDIQRLTAQDLPKSSKKQPKTPGADAFAKFWDPEVPGFMSMGNHGIAFGPFTTPWMGEGVGIPGPAVPPLAPGSGSQFPWSPSSGAPRLFRIVNIPCVGRLLVF